MSTFLSDKMSQDGNITYHASPLHTAVHPHEAALHQIGQEWKSDKRFVFKERHEKCRKE